MADEETKRPNAEQSAGEPAEVAGDEPDLEILKAARRAVHPMSPEQVARAALVEEAARANLERSLPFAGLDRQLQELAHLGDEVSTPMRELSRSWSATSANLQEIAKQSRYLTEVARVPSAAELTAESSRRTSEQIGQVAEIVDALLAQVAAGVVSAAELRSEMRSAAEDAKTTGNILIGLTIALVVFTVAVVGLTYVLVAEALHLWPFLAEVT